MVLRSSLLLAFVASFALALVGPGAAITGGQFDGNGHPYVGFVDNGTTACSGTLLSPTVMLTAAHCFSGSTSVFGRNSETGAPIVRLSFDPDLINTPRDQRVWFFGSYYFDPDFRLGDKGGLPGNDTHDLAVVVLTAAGCAVPDGQNGNCGPIPSGVTSGQYGALPRPGLIPSLPMNASLEIVGFGVQSFVRGGGPCGGPCKPRFGDAFTRYAAQTTLIASEGALSPAFIKLHANEGGVCFGDSGGPDLLAGTKTVIGVNAFDTNNLCNGVTYSYRIDSPAALGWIAATVAARGGSI